MVLTVVRNMCIIIEIYFDCIDHNWIFINIGEMLLLHCANNADLCTGWDSACKIAKTALAMYKSPKKRGKPSTMLTIDQVSDLSVCLFMCRHNKVNK